MSVNEKIKYYRVLRGLSQVQLANLSDISVTNIRKYENGTRNPKTEQLQKITKGLNINLFVLLGIEIETFTDLIPYLFEIDTLATIKFLKNSENEHNVSISFENPVVSSFLKEWADVTELANNLRADAENCLDLQAKEYLLRRAKEIENEFKIKHLTISK